MSKSLEEVHQSVQTEHKKNGLKRIFAFLGPAYLISVGYMDPGNWATDLAGGSQFGYSLLWVLVMSNIMALLLQSLSARLGIVAQKDLAQASKETYPKIVNFLLYILAEIAIAACDLAEILGMAIGLNLLLGIPLFQGVLITVLDTFLLLFLINKGIRKMEAFIVVLIAVIGFSFVLEMFFAQPEIGQVVKGFIPALKNQDALYIAIGIIGATVMPHNLYLHSSLVQTRKFKRDTKGIKQAIKYNLIDSTIALNLAFFVNAALLILAAATFYKNGLYHVAEIQDTHQLLAPMLGTQWAAALFAIALIAAGQSSTITGTLAGQIVMEGYLNLRIQPWVRRILTRVIAIVPALIIISVFGEKATGKMLIFSQVVLSMQLGFAIIPLIHFVSDKHKMKGFQIGIITKTAAWLIATVIVGLNIKLVISEIAKLLQTTTHPTLVACLVLPVVIGFGVLLLYITFFPFLKTPRPTHKQGFTLHQPEKEFQLSVVPTPIKHIAVALDFSTADQLALKHAIALGGTSATYTLIHIVESVGAIMYGQHISDQETKTDQQQLKQYQIYLQQLGYQVHTQLGFGKPTKALSAIVNTNSFDLLVMGTHKHKGVKDLLFGTTVDKLRHAITIPIYVI